VQAERRECGCNKQWESTVPTKAYFDLQLCMYVQADIDAENTEQWQGAAVRNGGEVNIEDAFKTMDGHEWASNRVRPAPPRRKAPERGVSPGVSGEQQADEDDMPDDLLGGATWLHSERNAAAQEQNQTHAREPVTVTYKHETVEKAPSQRFAIGDRVVVRSDVGDGSEVYGVVQGYNATTGIYIVDEFRILFECTEDRYGPVYMPNGYFCASGRMA
jgi:hypothetical protein